MDDLTNSLPVYVSVSNQTEKALLTYNSKGPSLIFQSLGTSYDESKTVVEIEADIILSSDNRIVKREKKKRTSVQLKPIIKVERGYVPSRNRPDPFYPPSTDGWYSRITRQGDNALIFVHENLDESRFWISILNRSDMSFYEAHPILPFEVGVLLIADESIEYTAFFEALRKKDEALDWMNDVLSGPPPTWRELAKIAEDIYIPNFRLGKDMRETMEQLVSISYDSEQRTQIMAFLALVTKWNIPREDPIEYFERLRPLGVLARLLERHVACILSNKRSPQYVRILEQSVQFCASRPTRPLREHHQRNPWYLADHKISEQMKSIPQISIDFAGKLNEKEKVIIALPISKNQARLSQSLWMKRFLLMEEGLAIRCLLRPQSVGLVMLADITRAHQWPHKHMKWSAEIGAGGWKEPHIQVMEMPVIAAKKVLRARPNAVEVDWAHNLVNTSLYDMGKNKWRFSLARVINSLRGEKALRHLESEFGIWRTKKVFAPKLKWAKCLDATATRGYLADLEQPEYLSFLDLTSEELLSTIKDMREKQIADILYMPILLNLMTVAVVAQGNSSTICSLTRAFLKHAPSANVSIGKEGEWMLALVRLPPRMAYKLIETLPTEASKYNIALSCHRIVSFRSYTWGFYQRILKDDGTWDDDVSAMLSQIRLPYPDDSS